MKFQLKSPEFLCNIDIPDEYAFIEGGSGKGTSYLITLLIRLLNTQNSGVVCPHRISLITATTSPQRIEEFRA